MPDRNDDEIEVVKRVWGAAWRKSLDAARSAYQQAFDIAIKDPAIDQEFRRRFETALDKGKATVEVPIKLALALALRSGGRPSAKPRRPATVRARREALLDFAEARWAEYLAMRKS